MLTFETREALDAHLADPNTDETVETHLACGLTHQVLGELYFIVPRDQDDAVTDRQVFELVHGRPRTSYEEFIDQEARKLTNA